mgnify:FL=1
MKTKLYDIDLIEELAKPEYADLLGEFTERRYARDAYVYLPGHHEDLVFVVKTGGLRVFLAYGDREFSLAMLKPGEVFSSHTRAHVLAMEDSTLLVMPTDRFHHYISIYPELSRTIVGVLGELLKQTFSIIQSLMFKDASQRITEFLLNEARTNGRPGPEGVVIRPGLTMEEIAAVVGSSRQTVSSLVNDMIRIGLLRKEGRGTFAIPDVAKLESFAPCGD